MPDIKAIARNVKNMRNQMNETQEEFAEHCGISTETLGLIERSSVIPSLPTVLKIMSYTKCSFSDLLKTNAR